MYRWRLLPVPRSLDIDFNEPNEETTLEAKKQKREGRTILWEKKWLHDQFIWKLKEVGNQDRWQYLQNGTLKCETESLIFFAQKHVIQANLIKWKIDKSKEQTKCRMCSRADETINHSVSECLKLAQKEYKRTHDWIGSHIQWEICGTNGVHVKSKKYEHQPETVNCEWLL